MVTKKKGDIIIRVRACNKCKEYISIDVEDLTRQEMVQEFDGAHRNHTVVTVNLEEVEKDFKNVEDQIRSAFIEI
ncbi:MAG: hypothetical protein KGD63_12050 [Candidatus Lokiarchaeota archaeon]|nr:hypothetical protein [Candidatus Lokiarchaeota archaeon]